MKTFHKIFSILVIIIILTGCGLSSSFVSMNQLPESIGIEKIPKQTDYPEEDAVYLLEDHKVEIDYDEIIEKVHIIKKVFRNIDSHSEASFTIMSDEKLLLFNARTIKPNGVKIETLQEDMYTESINILGFKAEKQKFQFKGVESNSIIEYEYVIRRNNFLGIDSWYIQKEIPILKNNYTLEMPLLAMLILNWKYKTYNYSEVKPEKIIDSDVVFKWSVENVEPYKPEPFITSENDVRAHVRFAPGHVKSWGEIAELYFDTYDYLTEVTDDIKELSDSLVNVKDTENEKIKKIFDFVRDSDSEIYDETKYGKCEDRTSLLTALLKAQKLEPHIGLVKTINDGTLDFGFPSYSFSESIVYVKKNDNNRAWLYPYNEFCGVDDIPWYMQKADAMFLDEKNPRFDTIPYSFDRDNVQKIDLKIKFDDDLNVVYHTDIFFTGEINRLTKQKYHDASEEEKKEFCKNLLDESTVNPVFKNLEFTNLSSVNSKDTSQISFDLIVKNAYDKTGDLYLLNFDLFSFFNDVSWLNTEERTAPIFFRFPYIEEREITIELPDNFEFSDYPKNEFFSKSNLIYNIRLNEEKNILNIKEKFRIKKRLVPTENYEDVKDFFGVIQKVKNKRIVIKKNNKS